MGLQDAGFELTETVGTGWCNSQILETSYAKKSVLARCTEMSCIHRAYYEVHRPNVIIISWRF